MDAMVKAMTPGAEHERLARFAGTWQVTTTMQMDPSAPPEVTTGRAQRRMILGGRVMEETFKGTMMGQPYEGFGITGYDNLRKEFWGTWNDTASTGIYVMRGNMDAAKGRMVMQGETTDPMSGNPMQLRIETHHQDAREIHEFYWTGPDGRSWKGMEMVYERA